MSDELLLPEVPENVPGTVPVTIHSEIIPIASIGPNATGDDIEEVKTRLKRRLKGKKSSGIPVRSGRFIAVTIGDLADAVQLNPNHPVGKVYAEVVRKYSNRSAQVSVDSVDFQALLENRRVIQCEVTSHDGETVQIKKLD